MPIVTKFAPLPELPKIKNVGIYCRVSSTHADQLASLSNQISQLTRMVMARTGWRLSDIYIDVKSAETGKKRPEYDRLLRDCRVKNLDLVITKSISRLGRDTVELLTTIRELKDLGIGVLFEQERLSTESADSEHIITIIEAFAQGECEARSANTRWGLEKRAKDGTCGLYKRRCFGYYTDENGDLQINTEEAKVVRSIFEMYLSGESLVGIINKLALDGVKTPTGKEKWCKNTLDKLLSNEKYTGKVMVFKSFSAKLIDSVAAPKTHPNNGEFKKYMISDSHPEIIPPDIFEAVQAEKARRTNVEKTENGLMRKSTRYSAKREKTGKD